MVFALCARINGGLKTFNGRASFIELKSGCFIKISCGRKKARAPCAGKIHAWGYSKIAPLSALDTSFA